MLFPSIWLYWQISFFLLGSKFSLSYGNYPLIRPCFSYFLSLKLDLFQNESRLLFKELGKSGEGSPEEIERLISEVDFHVFYTYMIINYNIANVNSERWLAESRVDITVCQHGKFPATLLLKFIVLYYKRNIKHFFRIDIQLYQHSWKLEKLEIVWKHSALRASCFHTISRFSNFHSCWYNCISTRKMFYIS